MIFLKGQKRYLKSQKIYLSSEEIYLKSQKRYLSSDNDFLQQSFHVKSWQVVMLYPSSLGRCEGRYMWQN